MIIYRPHRGGLAEAMAEAREFESIEAMKEYIVEHDGSIPEWGHPFEVDDIVIGENLGPDNRIGWNDVHHICTKRYYSEDFMAKYGNPQCIGMCATDYGSLEQSQRMCKEFLEGK